MKVYHGGIIEINHPDVNHSQKAIDNLLSFESSYEAEIK